MLSFIRSYKYQNVFIIMLLLLQNLLLLASTLTTMRMARLVMDGDFEGIVACMIFVIIVYLTLHFLFWIYDVQTARTIAHMNQDVRASLNRQIIERNAEELNGTDTGEYISWYTNDLKEAETQGFQNFYSAVDAVIKLTIGIAVLARIQWKLLICTLLTSGMVYVFSHYFHGNVEEESGKVSKGWETFTQAVKEQVGGVHVLKSFGHEMDFKGNIQTASRELERQRCRYVKTREKAALKMKGINAFAGLVNNLVLFGMCAFRVIPAEIFFGGGNLTNQVKESILSLSEIRIAFAG